MTILTREQIDAIESMGVQCVAVDSLFETARAAAESEKRYTDLRDAVLALHEHRYEGTDGFDPFCGFCLVDWPCPTAEVVARVERGASQPEIWEESA